MKFNIPQLNDVFVLDFDQKIAVCRDTYRQGNDGIIEKLEPGYYSGSDNGPNTHHIYMVPGVEGQTFQLTKIWTSVLALRVKDSLNPFFKKGTIFTIPFENFNSLVWREKENNEGNAVSSIA